MCVQAIALFDQSTKFKLRYNHHQKIKQDLHLKNNAGYFDSVFN